MPITVDLTDVQRAEFVELANRRGLTLEECVRRELEEALARERRFVQTADYLLEKNAELYRRLAR